MFKQSVGSALKATSPAPSAKYSFQKLRDHLPSEKKDIADDLDAVRQDIETEGAIAAAERLLRLDEYAMSLPPESLAGLVDSNAALEELEESISARYLYPWLVAARNLLALLPLLFTWWSLSRATTAYQTEVHLHPNLVYQPFLMLWENGFGQGMWPTFSFVAGADAILFILIIGVTAVVHWLERKAQTRARQIVASMDQSVMQLVAALGQSRLAFSGNPSDWAAAVHRVIEAAMKLTSKQAAENQAATRAAVAAAQAAADTAKASRTGIEDIAEQTRDYIRQVKGEFAETVDQFRAADKAFFAQLKQETEERLTVAFADTTKQMSDEFKRVALASLEAVERAQDAIVQVRQESKDAIMQVGQELQNATAQVNAENRQFLADTNRESLATLAAASEKADRISEGLRSSAESLQEAIKQHKDGAEALVESMAKIGEVTQRFGDNMQTFTSTTATMDTHVQEVAQAHERFTQRVETMATALASAADETKAATVGMQATTAQMTDALSQVTAMSGEVTRANQQWAQTQADLPHIAQAMHDAANNLRNLRVTVDMSQVPLVGRMFRRKAA